MTQTLDRRVDPAAGKTLDITPTDLLKTLGITATDLLKTLVRWCDLADLADDAEAKLEDGAEAKLEDGAEVDVNTEGKTVPVGELPEGKSRCRGQLVPIEDLPEDVKILCGCTRARDAHPDRQLCRLGRSVPIEAIYLKDIEIPFACAYRTGQLFPIEDVVPETDARSPIEALSPCQRDSRDWR